MTRPVAGGPGEEVHPARDRHRAAVRVLPRRRDEHGGGPVGQAVHEQPAVVDRDGDRLDAEALERAPEVRARRVLHRERAPVGQPQPRRGRERALGAGRDDDLLGRRPDGPRHAEVRRQLGAQPRVALRPAVRRRRLRVGGEVAPGPRQEPLPDRATGTGRGWWSRSGSRTAAREWVPSKNGRRGPADARAGRPASSAAARARQRARPQPAPQVGQPGRDEGPPPGPRLEVSLRGELLVGRHHRHRADAEVPGVGPDPGEACPGADPAVEDRPAERDLDLAVERQARGPVEDDRRIGHPGSPIPAFPIHTPRRRTGVRSGARCRRPHPGVPIRTPSRWERPVAIGPAACLVPARRRG